MLHIWISHVADGDRIAQWIRVPYWMCSQFSNNRNQRPLGYKPSGHRLIESGLMLTGLNLCTKQNLGDFFVAKVFFWTQNFKSENFMLREWNEEKFLKGRVCHQMKLCFWNRCQMTALLLMQLASYRYMLTREIKYHLYVLTHFIY